MTMIDLFKLNVQYNNLVNEIDENFINDINSKTACGKINPHEESLIWMNFSSKFRAFLNNNGINSDEDIKLVKSFISEFIVYLDFDTILQCLSINQGYLFAELYCEIFLKLEQPINILRIQPIPDEFIIELINKKLVNPNAVFILQKDLSMHVLELLYKRVEKVNLIYRELPEEFVKKHLNIFTIEQLEVILSVNELHFSIEFIDKICSIITQYKKLENEKFYEISNIG